MGAAVAVLKKPADDASVPAVSKKPAAALGKLAAREASRLAAKRRRLCAPDPRVVPGATMDAESRKFTPSELQPDCCMARTWNDGKGGQCERQPVNGPYC